MHWLRWLFFLICAWAVISAWAEDKGALSGSPRSNLYLVCLGIVAVFAILFEVRAIVRERQ